MQMFNYLDFFFYSTLTLISCERKTYFRGLTSLMTNAFEEEKFKYNFPYNKIN